jgi:hypothetical protein
MTRPPAFRTPLRPHPSTPSVDIASFDVDVDIDVDDSAGLSLRYRVTGAIDRIRVPVPATPVRTDALWRSTCFELFVGAPSGDGYVECNFAPSGAWAAYAFDACREGMRPHPMAAPVIAASASATVLVVDVSAALPFPLAADRSFSMGLTAVIESSDGVLSYWALAHPADCPDFHHRDGRVLRLGRGGVSHPPETSA